MPGGLVAAVVWKGAEGNHVAGLLDGARLGGGDGFVAQLFEVEVTLAVFGERWVRDQFNLAGLKGGVPSGVELVAFERCFEGGGVERREDEGGGVDVVVVIEKALEIVGLAVALRDAGDGQVAKLVDSEDGLETRVDSRSCNGVHGSSMSWTCAARRKLPEVRCAVSDTENTTGGSSGERFRGSFKRYAGRLYVERTSI